MYLMDKRSRNNHLNFLITYNIYIYKLRMNSVREKERNRRYRCRDLV